MSGGWAGRIAIGAVFVAGIAGLAAWDASTRDTSPDTEANAPAAPGALGPIAGAYRPMDGVCSHLDVVEVHALGVPIEQRKAQDTGNDSNRQILCEYAGEQPRGDGPRADTRSANLLITSQIYRDMETASRAFGAAAADPGLLACSPAGLLPRAPVGGLGTRAFADQCLDVGGYPPKQVYSLSVLDDNLVLRVVLTMIDSMDVPDPAAVVQASQAEAEHVMEALRMHEGSGDMMGSSAQASPGTGPSHGTSRSPGLSEDPGMPHEPEGPQGPTTPPGPGGMPPTTPPGMAPTTPPGMPTTMPAG